MDFFFQQATQTKRATPPGSPLLTGLIIGLLLVALSVAVFQLLRDDDETADAWQRRAALATGAIGFTMEQFLNVADVLDTLEAVTLNSPAVSTCDMFTGSPPDGVVAQGEVTITWLGSGELAEGDDFIWDFNQCWSVDGEELIHGTVNLRSPGG